MKKAIIIFTSVFLALQLIFPQRIFAEYVMPYPGEMPGSKLYKLSELIDTAKEWWSFGSLSSFSYHLSMADKKLIQAKVLFEYGQYLLATQALPEYNQHIRDAKNNLNEASNEGKDTTKKRLLFKEALEEHKQILEFLKQTTPQKFLWAPEKVTPQELYIHRSIENLLNTIMT